MTTRRETVRIMLFARGTLVGADCSRRCAVVDLSAGGARLTMTAPLPEPPLRLRFQLAGEELEFPVEIVRVPGDGAVAVAFPRPYSERLYHLIAEEQRHALARGRVNISERRALRGSRRPEAVNPPDG